MSSPDRCQRCEELAIIPRARGTLHRCPLCASQIVKMGDATYRLESTSPVRSAGFWTHLATIMLGTCAALLLVAIIIAAICFATLRSLEHSRLITANRLTSQEDWSHYAPPSPVPPPVPLPHTVTSPTSVASLTPRTVQANSAAPPAAMQFRSAVPAQPTPVLSESATPSEQRALTKFYLPYYSTQHRLALLDDVVEVALVAAPPTFSNPYAAAKFVAGQSDEMRDLAAHKAGLIDHLLKTRTELAGLPFLLGKDCQLASSRASDLETHSQLTRQFLATVSRASASAYLDSYSAVQAMLSSKLLLPEGVPAYHQILSGEEANLRLALVKTLEKIGGREAGRALANRAVFDLSEEVRHNALQALKEFDASIITGDLLSGLRYPFAPVNNNAAEALVALNLKSALPELVALLEQPAADEPVQKKIGDRQPFVRRELVRINHSRNCLLCHAPAEARVRITRGQVNGVVPALGSPLPTRVGQQYYASGGAGVLVRADTTYLRQDFSVNQHVGNAEPWPSMQRFDFLVRERELTCAELDEWQQQEQANAAKSFSDQRRAVVFALQALTREDFGDDPITWKNYLDSAHNGPKTLK